MTPTYAGVPGKGGYCPSPVNRLLKDKTASQNLVGVIGTGDINWGSEYCAAAHEVSNTHNVPILHRIDRWGNNDDYQTINTGIKQHWDTLKELKWQTAKQEQTTQNTNAEDND